MVINEYKDLNDLGRTLQHLLACVIGFEMVGYQVEGQYLILHVVYDEESEPCSIGFTLQLVQKNFEDVFDLAKNIRRHIGFLQDSGN